VQAGISGNPLNLGRETYLHYFAPRFGLAYRLNEQTVLRSAFGISYAPFTNNQYAFNYPLRSNQDSSQANGNALPVLQGGPANMATGIPAAPVIAVLPGGLVAARPGESYTVIDKHFREPMWSPGTLPSSVRCPRALPWRLLTWAITACEFQWPIT